MKKLLAILLFASLPALADEWWEVPTQAGGKIVLTTQTADWCAKGFFIVYIETSKQDAVYGCWTTANDRIHVKFNDGNFKIYDKEGWVYRTDKK